MEHVKRLVLVPEHMAENTTARKPLVPPLTTKVNDLDEEMDNLLKRRDVTEDEKARLHNQIFQRYLNYYDKRMSQPVRVSVVPPKPTTDKTEVQEAKPTADKAEIQAEPTADMPDNVEVDIMDSVRPTMKSRARQLVKKLKENKDLITWDDKAQLIYEGKPVPGSNVIDLVNDALRHRKNFNPQGWRLFAKALSDVNVPEGIVRNENRLKTIREYKTGTLHEPDEGEVNATPSRPPLSGFKTKARKKRIQLASRPYKWFR